MRICGCEVQPVGSKEAEAGVVVGGFEINFTKAGTMSESQIAALQTGRYRPMADAPKDGTAVMVLLNGSDIPLPARWRDQMSQMATGGNGWYVTWDNHKLSVHDGPRGWLPIPDEWLPEAQPAGQKLTLDTAPVGTKAPAVTGGYWTRVGRGWRWCTGSTFPRPGADWTGELLPPADGIVWRDVESAPCERIIRLLAEHGDQRKVFAASASVKGVGEVQWQITTGWAGWTKLHGGWNIVGWAEMDVDIRPSSTVENDCEDQDMSSVSDGCSKWPCNKEPLIKSGNGWVCTKCGGSY